MEIFWFAARNNYGILHILLHTYFIYSYIRTEIFASNENALQNDNERKKYSILFLDESKFYIVFNG